MRVRFRTCRRTPYRVLLGEELGNNFAADVGQSEIAALKAEGELAVVKTQKVQERRLKVMNVYGIIDRGESKFIRATDGDSRLDPAACHPHRKGVDVMVASHGLSLLSHGGTSEFPTPNHESLVEQPALLEILDQCRAGPVNIETYLIKTRLQILARPAMVIPIRVIELDEANSAFHQ